jgi:hypothetical protein
MRSVGAMSIHRDDDNEDDLLLYPATSLAIPVHKSYTGSQPDHTSLARCTLMLLYRIANLYVPDKYNPAAVSCHCNHR